MGWVSMQPLWNEYWLPILAAIESGAMTKADGQREWERILDQHFGRATRPVRESDPSTYPW